MVLHSEILQVRTTSPAAFTRATVVTAVKYSVVERPEKLDEIIFPEISSFLMLIKDGDRVGQMKFNLIQ